MKARLGPYYPFIISAAALAAFLTASRIALTASHWEHLTSLSDFANIVLQGLRVDAASIARLYALPIALFTGASILPKPIRRTALWTCVIAMTVIATLFVFFEVITPAFIDEYGSRPERKFFEYLNSPRETVEMLWMSFRVQIIMACSAVVLGTVLTFRFHRRLFEDTVGWHFLRTAVSLPFVFFVLFIASRSTFDGKPLHPGQVAFSSDILLNNLALNSLFSASYAAYRMREEIDPGTLYGYLPEREIRNVVAADRPATAAKSSQVVAPARPLNIVVILEESLGARFVKSLGGADLTPRLEQLAAQGWWFERMYATGTRSVRGIEAVLSGFPPTPGRSVVRLVDSQSRFFTLAALLKEAGYENGFFYGGRSDFDNMRGFALSNGFDYVFDENDITDGKFRSTYGYCDADVFRKIHERLLANTGKPNFIVTLTTSNHQPFAFPVDPGEVYEQPLATRENAVRYADKALGEFISKAQAAPYWRDTLFLIVADHDARVADFMSPRDADDPDDESGAFPVDGFHIPALILGGGIAPRRLHFVASQIDLPTTLLGLAGVQGPHPMMGRDLTAVDDDYEGRAIMQFMDYQAHLDADRITILRPSQAPLSGRYVDRRFVAYRDDSTGAREDRALAWALWPGVVYRKDEYYVDYCRGRDFEAACIH